MVSLWGQALPCGDALAVMYGLGLNIIAHRKGDQAAFHVLHQSLLMLMVWSAITLTHVVFTPLPHHAISEAHQLIFSQTPWICLASWFSFYIAQTLERFIYKKLIAKYAFSKANALSTLLSQTVDTVLFTLIGLYHQPIDFITVIAWSLFIKTLAWSISNAGVHIFYENNSGRRISV